MRRKGTAPLAVVLAVLGLFATLFLAICFQTFAQAEQAKVHRPEAPPPAFARPQPGANPFAGQTPPAFRAPAGNAAQSEQGIFSRLQVWILETQQSLHRDLARTVRELKADPFQAGLTLILLSFVYGVLHAAGPGHGKAVISSYVIANRETARRAVAISFASAMVQGFSAVSLVLGLGLILNMAGFEMQAAVSRMEAVSFAFVALIGAWLFGGQLMRLFRRIFGRERRMQKAASLSAAAVEHHHHTHAEDHEHGGHHNHHDHDHDHGPGCGCGHAHLPEARELEGPLSWRKAAAIVLAVGIRPCTGAILVLVFALTQGLFWAGVLSTFAMAIGTAITVSALTLAAVGARDMTTRIAGSGNRAALANILYDFLALTGAFLIFAIGAVLFFGSLGPAKPF